MECWVDLGTAVKVRSPYPRLYTAVAVAINTAVRGPLTPQSDALTTRLLRPWWQTHSGFSPRRNIHAAPLRCVCCRTTGQTDRQTRGQTDPKLMLYVSAVGRANVIICCRARIFGWKKCHLSTHFLVSQYSLLEALSLLAYNRLQLHYRVYVYTQGEVTSQSLWSGYDRHFVGINII